MHVRTKSMAALVAYSCNRLIRAYVGYFSFVPKKTFVVARNIFLCVASHICPPIATAAFIVGANGNDETRDYFCFVENGKCHATRKRVLSNQQKKPHRLTFECVMVHGHDFRVAKSRSTKPKIRSPQKKKQKPLVSFVRSARCTDKWRTAPQHDNIQFDIFVCTKYAATQRPYKL